MRGYGVALNRQNYVSPPSSLFRFRPFDCEKYIERELEELLRNRRVRVSNPETFNDPYDCKLGISLEPTPLFLHRLRVALSRESVRKRDLSHGLGWIDDFSKIPASEHNDLQRQFVEALARSLTSYTYVACFSKSYRSAAMWYHYANNYSGVCYELMVESATADDWLKMLGYSPGRFISEVGYKNVRTSYTSSRVADIYYSSHAIPHDHHNFIRQTFFEKSKDWEYEQEVRLIQNTQNFEEAGTYSSVAPYRCNKIILGPHVSKTLEKTVINYCEKYKVECVKGINSPKSFGISLSSL